MYSPMGLRSVVLSLGLAVAGCTKPGTDSSEAKNERAAAVADAPPDPGSEPVTCDATHAEQLRAELHTMCDIREQVPDVDVPAVPWSVAPDPGSPYTRGMVLEVVPEGVRGSWPKPVSVATLAARLSEEYEREREQASALDMPEPVWVLAIPAGHARRDVAEVLEVLASKGWTQGTLWLATEQPGPSLAPRDPARLAQLRPRIEGLSSVERPSALADDIRLNVGLCLDLISLFLAVATVGHDQRCRAFEPVFPEALVGCGCVNEDELMTLLYGGFVGARQPQRWSAFVPVVVDPQAEPQPGATWGEIVAATEQGELRAFWVDAE